MKFCLGTLPFQNGGFTCGFRSPAVGRRTSTTPTIGAFRSTSSGASAGRTRRPLRPASRLKGLGLVALFVWLVAVPSLQTVFLGWLSGWVSELNPLKAQLLVDLSLVVAWFPSHSPFRVTSKSVFFFNGNHPGNPVTAFGEVCSKPTTVHGLSRLTCHNQVNQLEVYTRSSCAFFFSSLTPGLCSFFVGCLLSVGQMKKKHITSHFGVFDRFPLSHVASKCIYLHAQVIVLF